MLPFDSIISRQLLLPRLILFDISKYITVREISESWLNLFICDTVFTSDNWRLYPHKFVWYSNYLHSWPMKHNLIQAYGITHYRIYMYMNKLEFLNHYERFKSVSMNLSFFPSILALNSYLSIKYYLFFLHYRCSTYFVKNLKDWSWRTHKKMFFLSVFYFPVKLIVTYMNVYNVSSMMDHMESKW